ncbi:MAG: DUF3606 domain-containing protein [Comamonadaceae bacterium]|nr:MAG: DUF3606 domain-containing protein [Comamonadaceae bacterium]
MRRVLHRRRRRISSMVLFRRSITMSALQNHQRSPRKERIDVSYDYAVCAWARHFNVSQASVKAAVAEVGPEAARVREHLHRPSSGERPSSH